MNEEKKAIAKMAGVGVVGNVFLAIFKIIAGTIGHSAAMVSDAVHTLSDVFATVVAFIGVTLSKKEADREHPYGHERMECVASLILGTILFLTGLSIGINCIRAIADGSYLEMEEPGLIAVIAALVSIVVKEAMFWYTMYYARKFKSSAFKADAWHHRSDAISSIGALIGIIGARNGVPIMDQLAGIVICIMILWVAFGIFKDAIGKMLDTSCDDKFESDLKDFVIERAGQDEHDVGVDLCRTRKFGEKIYVELEINADGDMSLNKAHEIADILHDAIEEKYPDVKHVMIHMNPAGYEYRTPLSY
ncbi:MAG: cation transporter [Lachnospiraceae bacterium]|nr:cation transporter [Lachnospiraceae bacterium]